ncbi:hypothetical protein [Methyloglobulus sp.]|uniref:hypothetical protein n=1 Tax=Methyloglobulus sp. TaxID=2518622 RepID=UPI0032B7A2B4
MTLILITAPIVPTTKAGSNTQTSSDAITQSPHSEKKLLTPIGETSIGLKGRNIRSKLKDQYKATPRPPLVMASRKAWEAQDTKQSQNTAQGLDRSCL